MSDPSTYSIYNASDIEMVGGHEAPPDHVIEQFASMLDEHKDIQCITSMAYHIVLGDNDMPDFKDSEKHLSNIAVLVPILAVLQAHRRRDIEKIENIPMDWFMRWNKSFDDAVEHGVIEKPNNHMTSKEFDNMMGD